MLSCNALLRRLVTRVFCRDLLQAVTRSNRKLWTLILSPILWMHNEYNRAMTRLALMMLISEVLCTVVLKIRIIACTDLDCMFFLWFDNFELCSQFECLLGVDVVCFHRSFLSTASTTCAVRSCCSATTRLTRMSCGLLHLLKTSSTALLLRLFCQVRSLLWTVCWWYFECYSVELSVVFLFFLNFLALV